MDYTFNRDLDVLYASDPAAKKPVSLADWLPRLLGVLDHDALCGLCALDPLGQVGITIQVLSAFECAAQRWRSSLQRAVNAEGEASEAEVMHTVHLFKSAALVVGALGLARLCSETERLAQFRRSRELDQLVDAIIAESRRILAVLTPLRQR